MNTYRGETRVAVQSEEKTGKNCQGDVWQYSLPGGNVIFDFQMGLSREGLRRMLGSQGPCAKWGRWM